MQPYSFDGSSNNQIIKGPIYWAVVISASPTGALISPSWSFNSGIQFTLGATGLWARHAPPGNPWNEIELFGKVQLLACHDPCEPFPQGFAQPQQLSGNFSRTEWTQFVRSGLAFSGFHTQAAVLGDVSFVSLTNPSGSGIRIILKDFSIRIANGSTNTHLISGAAITQVATKHGGNLLISTSTITPTQSIGLLDANHNGAGPSLSGADVYFTQNSASNIWEIYPRSPDFICEILPGFSIYAFQETTNFSQTAFFRWAEVPIGIAVGTYP